MVTPPYKVQISIVMNERMTRKIITTTLIYFLNGAVIFS